MAARGSLRGSSQSRLRIGFVLIAMVLSLFAARLVQLQGIDPRQYAAMAAQEGSVSVVLPAERGDILDRNGEPLAQSADGLMVIADPSLTSDEAPALATLLSKRLGIDYFETLDRLEATGSRFEYIARQVPAAKANKVVAEAQTEGLTGLYTNNDPVRAYPGRDVAANIVGFLGTPTNKGRAKPSAGLEASFNSYLAGRDGEARYQMGGGNRIPLGDNTVTDAVDGRDLTTTIDRDLQWYTQRVLRDTVQGAGGESGFAVVMDSRTGEIMALADHPTYDASQPDEYDVSTYNSRALVDKYEPGSVEKVLTVSGLVDAGKVTARTKFEVPGELQSADTVIHDYFEHGLIRLTMAGIIAKSSNIGTVKAAQNYAPGQLRDYLTQFGLGERTDVGLEGETPGIVPSGASWTKQVGERIAFGQSVSVNALQMAAAVNTIANGGVRVDPSLIKGEATDREGDTVGTATTTSRRVVSENAARQTTHMMERVVDPDAGVAPGAQVPGYTVAGKTGTAQRVDPTPASEGGCGCYDGSFTVSFAGFAPADDPRFTVYVVVQNPTNGGGGGSVAGPAFSQIMGYTLRHFGVPPTGAKPSQLPVEW